MVFDLFFYCVTVKTIYYNYYYIRQVKADVGPLDIEGRR